MSRYVFTPEQRARGGQTRSLQASFAAHNAQIAPAGYRAACAKHGEARILQAAIAKQRAQPSQAEQRAMRCLRALGRADYEHVYQPWPGRRYTVDFAWPSDRRAVEVLGGVHHKPELAHDPERFARLTRKIAALEADGWQVLCLDSRTPDAWEAQLRAFFGDEIPF